MVQLIFIIENLRVRNYKEIEFKQDFTFKRFDYNIFVINREEERFPNIITRRLMMMMMN